MRESKIKKKRSKYLLLIAFILLIVILITIYLVGFDQGGLKDDSIFLENKNKLIVLISLDGLGSNLISSDTPYLSSILSSSDTSYTLEMQTLEQSETLPSHVSMVTGLFQENHNVLFNSVDSSTPPLSKNTIFDFAIDNGYSYTAFVTKGKLLYLFNSKVGENITSKEQYSSDVIDDIDNLVVNTGKDSFVFIHLRDIDLFGHTYGWGSEKQKDALEILDNNLELIVSDLDSEFSSYDRYFVITADHGGEEKQHSNGCTNCRRIPLIVVSKNVGSKYVLDHSSYNIYDITCIILDIMDDTKIKNLDCK